MGQPQPYPGTVVPTGVSQMATLHWLAAQWHAAERPRCRPVPTLHGKGQAARGAAGHAWYQLTRVMVLPRDGAGWLARMQDAHRWQVTTATPDYQDLQEESGPQTNSGFIMASTGGQGKWHPAFSAENRRHAGAFCCSEAAARAVQPVLAGHSTRSNRPVAWSGYLKKTKESAMHLFHELFALSKDATLSMLVTSDQAAGTLTISVLPRPRAPLDQPALSKDLTLTGTPDEFAADFVSALTGYRTGRETLRQQAEATHAALQAAQADSADSANAAAHDPNKAGKAAVKRAPPAAPATMARPTMPATPNTAVTPSAPSAHATNPSDPSEPDMSWCKHRQPELF